eukprot:g34485.t1
MGPTKTCLEEEPISKQPVDQGRAGSPTLGSAAGGSAEYSNDHGALGGAAESEDPTVLGEGEMGIAGELPLETSVVRSDPAGCANRGGELPASPRGEMGAGVKDRSAHSSEVEKRCANPSNTSERSEPAAGKADLEEPGHTAAEDSTDAAPNLGLDEDEPTLSNENSKADPTGPSPSGGEGPAEAETPAAIFGKAGSESHGPLIGSTESDSPVADIRSEWSPSGLEPVGALEDISNGPTPGEISSCPLGKAETVETDQGSSQVEGEALSVGRGAANSQGCQASGQDPEEETLVARTQPPSENGTHQEDAAVLPEKVGRVDGESTELLPCVGAEPAADVPEETIVGGLDSEEASDGLPNSVPAIETTGAPPSALTLSRDSGHSNESLRFGEAVNHVAMEMEKAEAAGRNGDSITAEGPNCFECEEWTEPQTEGQTRADGEESAEWGRSGLTEAEEDSPGRSGDVAVVTCVVDELIDQVVAGEHTEEEGATPQLLKDTGPLSCADFVEEVDSPDEGTKGSAEGGERVGHEEVSADSQREQQEDEPRDEAKVNDASHGEDTPHHQAPLTQVGVPNQRKRARLDFETKVIRTCVAPIRLPCTGAKQLSA